MKKKNNQSSESAKNRKVSNVIICIIVVLFVAIGISNISKSNNDDTVKTNNSETVINDFEKLDSDNNDNTSYMDAIRKCTVMEATDIYTTGIGKKSDNVFNDARATCEDWYLQWGENDFFEAVYIDWENRKTEQIDGEPLTYYLDILGW